MAMRWLRPARILSLDGGGVRGLSALMILEKLMDKIADDEGLPVGSLKPRDYFDLICGTSTGGLIAILLGRLGLTARQAIDKYVELSKSIFAKDRSIGLGAFRVSKGGEERFDEKVLEQAIKDVASEYGDSPYARMFDGLTDPASRECHVFVVAVIAEAANNEQPHLFTTYDRNDDTKIWEAGRATSAAPVFFKAMKVGNPAVRYIDAGLGHNNPADVGLEEFHRLWPGRKLGLFLSLGTGKETQAVVRKGGSWAGFRNQKQLIEVLAKLATSANRVHGTVYKKIQREYGPEPYFRFNVDQGLSEIGLQEWKKEGELAGCTTAYLDGAEVNDRRLKCAERLRTLTTATRPFQLAANAFKVGSVGDMDNEFPGMQYWYEETATDSGYPEGVTVDPQFQNPRVRPIEGRILSLRRVCNLLLRGQAHDIPHGHYRITWITWIWAQGGAAHHGIGDMSLPRGINTVTARKFPSIIAGCNAPEKDSGYFYPHNILFSAGRAKNPYTFMDTRVDVGVTPLAVAELLEPGYREYKLEGGDWNTLRNTGWCELGSTVVEVGLDGHLAFVICKSFERKWIGGFAFGGVRLTPLAQ